jgi:hypothetical protein
MFIRRAGIVRAAKGTVFDYGAQGYGQPGTKPHLQGIEMTQVRTIMVNTCGRFRDVRYADDHENPDGCAHVRNHG